MTCLKLKSQGFINSKMKHEIGNVYYQKNKISHISYIRTTKQSFLVRVYRKKKYDVKY